MSLIHWWPLNGDTKDYGINNSNGSGGVVNNDGKIGKCYECKNSSYLTLPYTCETSDVYSFAMWIKIPSSMSSNTDWETILAYSGQVGDTTGTVPYDWTPYQNFKIPDTVNHQYIWLKPGTDFNYDEWFHLTVVCDNNGKQLTKIYINNTLKGTYNTISQVLRIRSGILTLGSGVNTGSVFFNDVRIYNHALSNKEVKEISKGLVLHYNFEDPYVEGTTNLITSITAGGQTTVQDGVVTTSGVNADTYFTLHLSENLTQGTVYTISCVAENMGGKTFAFPIGGQNNVDLPFVIKEGYNAYTFTMNSFDAGAKKCFMDDTERSAWANKCRFYNWQLEKKDHATPYVNGTRAQGAVVDNSGYGYNGTINGNLTLANDSTIPSGTKSMKFASDSYLDIPVFPEFKELTCSFWIKIPNATVSYRSLFNQLNSPTGSLWLSVNTESYGLWSYMASSPSYSGAGDMLQANTWYFATFIFNNGYANWYLNGEYLGRNVFYPSRLVIPSTHFCLGDSYSGGSWSGTPFDGWIADFKLFATALSAEDIKAEYNRKASIDRNGNLFTGEVNEENTNISITKKNQVQTYSFKEGSDIAKFFGGYTQLEYIESTGTQYINTNVISSYNLTLETSIAITEEHPTTKYRSLFGNEASWVMNFVEDSTGIRWVGQDINMYITTYSLNEKMFIYAGKDFMYKNGVSIPRSADGNSVSYGNFLIGKGYNNTTIGKFKLYNFKIYDSGELVRDFVPAKRNKDSIIGLYDLVEHKFYTNQGTGTFTGGTEIGPLSAIALNEIKEI